MLTRRQISLQEKERESYTRQLGTVDASFTLAYTVSHAPGTIQHLDAARGRLASLLSKERKKE